MYRALLLLLAMVAFAIPVKQAEAQDGIPDYHAETRPYLDRTFTAFFDRIPTELSSSPAFQVRITKLIDRKSCTSDVAAPSTAADLPNPNRSNFAQADILDRRNTVYSAKTVKICLAAAAEGFSVGDEGLVVAHKAIGDTRSFIFPTLQSLRERRDARRNSGGWCLWTWCFGGQTGL